MTAFVYACVSVYPTCLVSGVFGFPCFAPPPLHDVLQLVQLHSTPRTTCYLRSCLRLGHATPCLQNGTLARRRQAESSLILRVCCQLFNRCMNFYLSVAVSLPSREAESIDTLHTVHTDRFSSAHTESGATGLTRAAHWMCSRLEWAILVVVVVVVVGWVAVVAVAWTTFPQPHNWLAAGQRCSPTPPFPVYRSGFASRPRPRPLSHASMLP